MVRADSEGYSTQRRMTSNGLTTTPSGKRIDCVLHWPIEESCFRVLTVGAPLLDPVPLLVLTMGPFVGVGFFASGTCTRVLTSQRRFAMEQAAGNLEGDWGKRAIGSSLSAKSMTQTQIATIGPFDRLQRGEKGFGMWDHAIRL